MQYTYSLCIVHHVLAICKYGDGAARHIVLLPSEDHSSIFPGVVVGEERQAQLFFRQFIVVCLQVQKTNQTRKKIDC